jgi:predicted DNA-binding transcriptional regulator AlpA
MSNIKLNSVKTPELPLPSVPRFERAAGACSHFKIGRSTLWMWVKTWPGFPKPIKASQRVTLFDLAAIEAFLISKSVSGGAHD